MNIQLKYHMVAVGIAAVGIWVLGTRLMNDPHPPLWAPMVLIVPVFLIGRLLWKNLPQEGALTRQIAERIASETWYLKRADVFEEEGFRNIHGDEVEPYATKVSERNKGAVLLELVTVNSRRASCAIPLLPGHPSIPQVMECVPLEEVRFEFVDPPLPCGSITDLCSYLVLKKV